MNSELVPSILKNTRCNQPTNKEKFFQGPLFNNRSSVLQLKKSYCSKCHTLLHVYIFHIYILLINVLAGGYQEQ